MESAITAGFAAAAGAAVPDELDFILQDSGTSLIDIDLRQRPAKRPIDAIEGAASQLDDAVLSASASNAAPNAALAITRAGQPASASGEPDSSESSTLSKRLRVRTTPMQPTDAATLESVAQKLRECLERLLPSDWDHHSPEELMDLDLAGLAKFPLPEFLDEYKLQIKTYVEVRLEDAELRINTEEENLKAKAITAEGLRQTLADLRTLERMPQANLAEEQIAIVRRLAQKPESCRIPLSAVGISETFP